MTSILGDYNEFVTNNYFPIMEIPFEKLKRKHPIQKGDWVIQQNITPYKFWVLYKPNGNESYNCYHLGLSHDPKSIFYWKNKLPNPQIIRQSDEKLKSIVLDCLDNRLKE